MLGIKLPGGEEERSIPFNRHLYIHLEPSEASNLRSEGVLRCNLEEGFQKHIGAKILPHQDSGIVEILSKRWRLPVKRVLRGLEGALENVLEEVCAYRVDGKARRSPFTECALYTPVSAH